MGSNAPSQSRVLLLTTRPESGQVLDISPQSPHSNLSHAIHISPTTPSSSTTIVPFTQDVVGIQGATGPTTSHRQDPSALDVGRSPLHNQMRDIQKSLKELNRESPSSRAPGGSPSWDNERRRSVTLGRPPTSATAITLGPEVAAYVAFADGLDQQRILGELHDPPPQYENTTRRS
jgi:hypothetical protein